MKILVIGVAGRTGFDAARKFLGRGDSVVGTDNLNGDSSAVAAKCLKLSEFGIRDAEAMLSENRNGDGTFPAPSRFCGKFRFYLCDAADKEILPAIFARERFDAVVNAVPGEGRAASNILDCCKTFNVNDVLYPEDFCKK